MRPPSRPGSTRICANCATSRRTHLGRRRSELVDTELVELGVVEARGEANPEIAQARSDERAELVRLLGTLPWGLRAVVVLRDIYDLPHEAIAAELGISRTAAKVRLHRARRLLRERLYAAARRAVTTSCAALARRLPGILEDGLVADDELVAHIEGCLACRSELARYRKMLRLLSQLRLEHPEVPEGLIEGVLASIGDAAERQMIRSALSHRRLAHLEALALGALALSGLAASGALVLARRRAKGGAGARQAEGASARS